MEVATARLTNRTGSNYGQCRVEGAIYGSGLPL